MGALDVVRIGLVVAGALAILGGLGLAVSGEEGGPFFGFWLVVTGLIFFAAVALERMRYRSLHAERTLQPPGPGGGETEDTRLEPRFRPTDEVFLDPTSGHRMRVWLDPAGGERRYVAED
jgi:hypothetical protein